jgi:uncharacterized membrane-anchored protein YjiN (DUF445 family)
VDNPDYKSVSSFLQRHKGDIALVLSLILYLLSWPIALVDHAVASVVRAAGEASLVGGLCDYIALNMIFEQHWYLPNSGVLPRNREKLIDGIAKTIEKEWLTPEMIGNKLHELRPLDRIGDYLKTASLRTIVRPEQLEHLCESAAQLLEPNSVIAMVRQMTSGIAPGGPFERIRTAVLNVVVKGKIEVLRRRILTLPHDDELTDFLDQWIHEAGENISSQDSALHKAADHWMDELVRTIVVSSRGEITRMVKENLNRMSNEAIRTQIETRTRTHLDWIRVNGGVFGAILGCIFALLNTVHLNLNILSHHLSYFRF